MKSFRYVPHPEDLVEVELECGKEFSEIIVYINNEQKPFITQVNERMTVEDGYLVLYDEFVRKPTKQ